MTPEEPLAKGAGWQQSLDTIQESEKTEAVGTGRDGRKVTSDTDSDSRTRVDSATTSVASSGGKDIKALPVAAVEPEVSTRTEGAGKLQLRAFKIGSCELEPFTIEHAKAFFAAIQNPGKNKKDNDKACRDALFSVYKDAGATFADLKLIKAAYESRMRDTYDVNFLGKYPVPLLHSQVSIPGKEGSPVKLPANRIAYDDKNYGVALPAVVAANLEQMLQIIWQEKTGVLVDLHQSGSTTGKYHAEANTLACWGALSVGDAQEHDPFIVEKTGEEQDSEQSLRQTFRLRHKESGEERTFSRIHYTGWPDEGHISISQLDILHETIDQELMSHKDQDGLAVNCLAGLGRTGAFFATRRLRDRAIKQELDKLNLDAEAFNVIVQGKMARNNDFVRAHGQVCMIREAADYYSEKYLRQSDLP